MAEIEPELLPVEALGHIRRADAPETEVAALIQLVRGLGAFYPADHPTGGLLERIAQQLEDGTNSEELTQISIEVASGLEAGTARSTILKAVAALQML